MCSYGSKREVLGLFFWVFLELALPAGTALRWEGTTNDFPFADKWPSQAFANSGQVCVKDKLLSNYHHQPPNTVCKQVNDLKGAPKCAARLYSLLKAFNSVKNEGCRYFTNILDFKMTYQRLGTHKLQVESYA